MRKSNAKSNFQKRNRKLFTELKLSSCVNEDTDRYERQYAALTYFHSEDCNLLKIVEFQGGHLLS